MFYELESSTATRSTKMMVVFSELSQYYYFRIKIKALVFSNVSCFENIQNNSKNAFYQLESCIATCLKGSIPI